MMQLPRLLLELRRLEGHMDLSHEELIERQARSFRDLLFHAWDNTSFYPRFYQDHGIDRSQLDTISITELPPLDKQTYIDEFDALTTDEALTRSALDSFIESHERRERYQGEYTIVHSSGTTGEPTYFVYDRDAWRTVLAGALRAVRGELGYRAVASGFIGGFRVLYVAATEGRFAGVMAVNQATERLRYESYLLDVNEPLADWVDEVTSFDPNVIIGYPSAIKLLCDQLEDAQFDKEFIRVITGGEPLSNDLRSYIESCLETEVFNIYGASESIILGVERGAFDGMFLFDDLVLVEPQETETYITPLYNRSQPLIRYVLDDTLEPTQRDPVEPLPFTKVRAVVGRSEELLWFERPDGSADFLHPLILDDIQAPGLIRIQFVKRSPTHLELRLECESDEDSHRIRDSVSHQFDRILQGKELDHLTYAFTEIAEIPINPDTGKAPLVVRKTTTSGEQEDEHAADTDEGQWDGTGPD